MAGEHRLPEGCTGVYTIQARDCVVSHYYQCSGDAEGSVRRDDFSEEGLIFRGLTDAEGRWLESHHMSAQVVDSLGAERDPASISELLADGQDDFDFLTYSSNGARQRYSGHDALTGESFDFDGLTLLGTEYEMRVEDQMGNWLWSSHGYEFVDPKLRAFIGGDRVISVPGAEEEARDGRPARVIFPGDPGFLSDMPAYGCGLMMSRLAPLLRRGRS